jgi:hypothetical protein
MRIPSTFVTRTACVFIIIVCSFVLPATLINALLPGTMLPAVERMKFNTAINLVFSAAPLLLLNQKNNTNPDRIIAFVSCLLFLHNRSYHFFIHVLLITGMVLLLFLFPGSFSSVSFGKAPAVINTSLLQSSFVFLTLYTAAFFSGPSISYLTFSFRKKLQMPGMEQRQEKTIHFISASKVNT